jgi:type III restriction enzyme
MIQTTLSQNQKWLYDIFDILSENNVFDKYKEIPKCIKDNLHPNFELRPYQIEAFARFLHYFNDYPNKELPLHLLYNMATGSGKTIIMAGLILYLYKKGYRNFLFFVNSTNIIEKTKNNFLNSTSSKFMYKDSITIDDMKVNVKQVDNFEGVSNDNINICFTTIQGLHSLLSNYRENSLTFEDFKDKKIAIISDEAHHINTWTKKNISNEEDIAKKTWEYTVNQIHQANKDNIMLEFTATMDFDNVSIGQKYMHKTIYKYDLKQFRNDLYSKDIEIVQSDTDKKGRILIALILSQYRQDIANKHGIDLKPVILFKAQRTIQQSKDNKELFHKTIDQLSVKQVEQIKKKVNIPIIQKAFKFYKDENIKINTIVQKLKINFTENKCLSVNEESEKEQYQLLLNSLEDRNNQIRAIFAVQKLNEGWDVLNLFDIVRLYEGQASGGGYKGKIAPSTLSEAQLIGRGARYFPFKLKNIDQEKFKRKYDNDLNNELRILEELHFHSRDEHRYIAELKKALVQEGLIDDRTVEKELKLKEEFKKNIFYKTGLVYKNEKLLNTFSNIKSFADLNVTNKEFKYNIFTFKGKVTQALTDDQYENLNIKREYKTIKLGEMDEHIILNALSKKDFFKFNLIKRYFPKLKSIRDLIKSKSYLSEIQVNFAGTKEDISDISNKQKLSAILEVLDEIENKLRDNIQEYIGSEEFKPFKISKIFEDKMIKVQKDSERADGQEAFLKDKEWYPFNANYGTDEEKACVEFIDRLFSEKLSKEYKQIYLLRNEEHFGIYDFDNGQRFCPDFVLFLKTKDNKPLTYQIFIEPKGKHLQEYDAWKENFLLKIQDKFSSKDLLKFIETNKYKVIGVPFYNKDDETQFKEELLNSLD